MARDFEDHCWRDIVSDEILRVYEPYHRDVYVGERPALLAIDLYNLVYRGGAKEPHEIIGDYPSTCGKYAWDAVEPTKALFAAARKAGDPGALHDRADDIGRCRDQPAGRTCE